MLPYILRRLIHLIPVMIGVTLCSFLLLKLAPGDPAEVLAGIEANPEVIEAIRRKHGLDQPLPVQYFYYLGNLMLGDFGKSISTGLDVGPMMWRALIVTLKLSALGLVLALVVGIVIGAVAAVRQNSFFDSTSMLFALFGAAMPNFWLGLLLMWTLSVTFPIFPAGGGTDLYSLILPAITLGTGAMALIARMTRASMLEVIRQDYIRTAYANGLSPPIVIIRHALKNAMIPISTVIGLQFGYLLGGSVATEIVFAVPGVGQLLVDGILARDYPVVQSTMLMVAIIFVLVNLITDISYAYFDPRIRLK